MRAAAVLSFLRKEGDKHGNIGTIRAFFSDREREKTDRAAPADPLRRGPRPHGGRTTGTGRGDQKEHQAVTYRS